MIRIEQARSRALLAQTDSHPLCIMPIYMLHQLRLNIKDPAVHRVGYSGVVQWKQRYISRASLGRTYSVGSSPCSWSLLLHIGPQRTLSRLHGPPGSYLGGLRLPPGGKINNFVLIFNVENFYANIWTLLKMYTENVPLGTPLFRFLNTLLLITSSHVNRYLSLTLMYRKL